MKYDKDYIQKRLTSLADCLMFIKKSNEFFYEKTEILYDGYKLFKTDENIINKLLDFRLNLNHIDNFNIDLITISLSKPFQHDFDKSVIYFNLDTFIKAIEDYKNIIVFDEDVIFTDKIALVPINLDEDSKNSLEYFSVWGYENSINSFNNSIFKYNTIIGLDNINFSLNKGFSFYSINDLIQDDFNFDEQSIYVKLENSNVFKDGDKEKILSLANSFLFSLSYAGIVRGQTLARDYVSFDFMETNIENKFDADKFEFIHGPGITKIARLYNSTFHNYDVEYTILQLTKILESISETARMYLLHESLLKNENIFENKITKQEIYILEDEIINNNKKFKGQENQLKETLNLILQDDHNFFSKFPKFIDSYVEAHKNVHLNTVLARAISQTRNSIAHSKFTYVDGDLTCPFDQYLSFIILLDEIVKKTIIWFNEVDKNIKISD